MKRRTNAMRLLEAQHIPYQVHEFSTDIRSAQDVADLLGVSPGLVYKTLVIMDHRGRPLLVLVPGDKELDLKGLARSLGEKKLRMATHQEAESLTGLKVGGISALCLIDKGFTTYAHEAILSLSRVYVSAGRRGTNLSLAPSDLLKVTSAQVVGPRGKSKAKEHDD